jgi:hypothetical protein
MGTNFLPLPSGGFTVLKPKQQTAPSHGFLPCKNNISDLCFDQCFFLLTKSSTYANNINTKTHSGPRTVTPADFFMPVSWPCGALKGTWLLDNSRNCPDTVRPGRSMGRGNSFGFFYCRNTKPIGGATMASKRKGFRSGSRPGRRIRLAPITRHYPNSKTVQGGA